MQSKTSFFDGRIYKNTLSRLWLLGLGCAAVWGYTLLTLSMTLSLGYNQEELSIQLLRTVIHSGSMIAFLSSAAMAAGTYAWLFFPRSTAFTAALPLRRETVFLSQMAAGFTLLEGAFALSLATAGLLGGLPGALASDILRVLAVVTLLHILFFGFASFCAGLTGSIFILPMVYAVLMYAAVALEASLRTLAQFLIFGLTGRSWRLTALSPAYYLRNMADSLISTSWEQAYVNGYWNEEYRVTLLGFTGWPLVLGYAAAGLVFAALSVVLIRRRRMECAGDVVAMPFLRKVFPWCAALAGALTMGLFVLKTVFGNNGYNDMQGSFHKICILLCFLLLGAFLGWFGAQGLLRKTLRVFDRSWVGFGVVCALIVLPVLGCYVDLFGVERAMVRPEQVAYVELFDNYSTVGYTTFSQPENIQRAMELQKKIAANKKLYVNAPYTGAYMRSSLQINWYGHDGQLLQSRCYVAPMGPMCWASNGDSWSWASDGNAWASDGDAWASNGNAWASWGNAWASGDYVPCGGANPALQDLEDLLNTPEGIRQRVEPDGVSVSRSSITGAYIYQNLGLGVSGGSLNLTAGEAWDLYSRCILPDVEDGVLGREQLCPVFDSQIQPGDRVMVSVEFSQGYDRYGPSYGYARLNVMAPADRCCAWLAEHGMYVTGWAPAEEPPAETSYSAVPQGELETLLENIRLTYDPGAAGTVVDMRWARSLLEWYSREGKDPFRTYELAKAYAAEGLSDEALPGKLESLRQAGAQLVQESTGLVRDRRTTLYDWDENTVNDLFNALRAGLTPTEIGS